MATYLFVYHGGHAPSTMEEGQQAMAAWGNWFASMGDDVVDGGNPVGASTTIHHDGSVVSNGGANPTTGYGVVKGRDLNDAIAKAKGCPILLMSGSIKVAETFEP